MFKNYCSTSKAIFSGYTSLHFFDVAAGYICKMTPRLSKKSLLFGDCRAVRKTKFKHALKTHRVSILFQIVGQIIIYLCTELMQFSHNG